MKCELCHSKTRGQRLCAPCIEMLQRLHTVWEQLKLAERGKMIYQALEQQKEADSIRAKVAGGG